MRSLLLSRDEEAARVLSRLMRDLNIAVDHHTDPHFAVQQLVQETFDSVIIDADFPDDANVMLQTMSKLPPSRTRLLIVLANAQSAVQFGFVKGAHLALYKPISVDRVGLALRAVRNLIARERRRGTERVPVEIPASLGRESGGTPAVIVDLSEGGAAIRCTQPIPSSGLLTVHCVLPGTTAPFMAAAEVVWQDTHDQSGIRFVNLTSAARRTLADWLKDKSQTNPKPTASKAVASGRN
jgi:CheY-like chemotaxis protein